MKRKSRWTPEAIRVARLTRGLSQEDLAQLLDVTTSTVSRWECGAFQASRLACLALDRVLGETTTP